MKKEKKNQEHIPPAILRPYILLSKTDSVFSSSKQLLQTKKKRKKREREGVREGSEKYIWWHVASGASWPSSSTWIGVLRHLRISAPLSLASSRAPAPASSDSGSGSGSSSRGRSDSKGGLSSFSVRSFRSHSLSASVWTLRSHLLTLVFILSLLFFLQSFEMVVFVELLIWWRRDLMMIIFSLVQDWDCAKTEMGLFGFLFCSVFCELTNVWLIIMVTLFSIGLIIYW